jgi:hypothetical protein
VIGVRAFVLLLVLGACSRDEHVGPYEANLMACGATSDAELAAVRAVTGVCRREEARVRVESRARVFVVTQGDLSDDSIRDLRHEVELEERAGAWHVARVASSQTCWEGRGHAWFSAQPCS